MEYISLTGLGRYIECKDAFLFSMVNPHGLGPNKMRHNSYCNAILGDSDRGPTFGTRNDHDLYISENANIYPSSCSNLGKAYEYFPGERDPYFLTGDRNFTVTNYEVFALNNWLQADDTKSYRKHFITAWWIIREAQYEAVEQISKILADWKTYKQMNREALIPRDDHPLLLIFETDTVFS